MYAFRSSLPEILLLLVGIALFALPGQASQFKYVFPTNISLALVEGPAGQGGDRALVATIKSRLGTLKDLEIFFESSQDLVVGRKDAAIAQIPETATEEIPLVISGSGKKADEMGSWVKMGVRYRPDYDKILTTIGNKEAYPIEYERKRLLTLAVKNKKALAKNTDVVRLFIEPTGGQKP